MDGSRRPYRTSRWHPRAGVDVHHQVEVLLVEEGNPDSVIAMVEWFEDDGPYYPCAINARTGNVERGGPMDAVDAFAWAERVAGLHPLKAGDDRPPFYYTRKR